MATNLTISLTDTEEAKVLEIAALVAPGMTPAEVKTWAERVSKDCLRVEVFRRLYEYRSEQVNDARQIEDDADVVAWPEDAPEV